MSNALFLCVVLCRSGEGRRGVFSRISTDTTTSVFFLIIIITLLQISVITKQLYNFIHPLPYLHFRIRLNISCNKKLKICNFLQLGPS